MIHDFPEYEVCHFFKQKVLFFEGENFQFSVARFYLEKTTLGFGHTYQCYFIGQYCVLNTVVVVISKQCDQNKNRQMSIKVAQK